MDIFAYGFPCNDFSLVCKQKGFDGDYGPLYTYGVKVLNQFNPLVFVAENVGGIKSANGGKAFERILFDLGYAGKGGYDEKYSLVVIMDLLSYWTFRIYTDYISSQNLFTNF